MDPQKQLTLAVIGADALPDFSLTLSAERQVRLGIASDCPSLTQNNRTISIISKKYTDVSTPHGILCFLNSNESGCQKKILEYRKTVDRLFENKPPIILVVVNSLFDQSNITFTAMRSVLNKVDTIFNLCCQNNFYQEWFYAGTEINLDQIFNHMAVLIEANVHSPVISNDFYTELAPAIDGIDICKIIEIQIQGFMSAYKINSNKVVKKKKMTLCGTIKINWTYNKTELDANTRIIIDTICEDIKKITAMTKPFCENFVHKTDSGIITFSVFLANYSKMVPIPDSMVPDEGLLATRFMSTIPYYHLRHSSGKALTCLQSGSATINWAITHGKKFSGDSVEDPISTIKGKMLQSFDFEKGWKVNPGCLIIRTSSGQMLCGFETKIEAFEEIPAPSLSIFFC